MDYIQILYPVWDRAHGANVAGKATPAYLVPRKYSDDDHLVQREWEWSEEVVDMLEKKWAALGFISERTIPDNDPFEPGLLERMSRINRYNFSGQLLTFSPHINAITLGDHWQTTASGITYFTSPSHTISDDMCTRLYAISEDWFKDFYHYKNTVDGDPDFEAKFAVLMAKGAAILAEVGFQDNRWDVERIMQHAFKDKITNMWIQWLIGENNLALQKIISHERI
jgi:hypothetical protein